MKKIILLTILSFFAFKGFAQTPEYIYCQIREASFIRPNNVGIYIDFGQSRNFRDDITLTDEDGKPVAFNSMVDAMNWLGADGWEFVQAYVVRESVYWILKKNIENLTEEERAEVTSKFNTRKRK